MVAKNPVRTLCLLTAVVAASWACSSRSTQNNDQQFFYDTTPFALDINDAGSAAPDTAPPAEITTRSSPGCSSTDVG